MDQMTPDTQETVVVGDAAIAEMLRKLNAQTEQEVNSFVVGRKVSASRLREAQEQNNEMYARGIKSRTIYLPEVRKHIPTLNHVMWLNERGSEVRTSPNLPLQMIIADKRTAVLPLSLPSNERAIIVQRNPSVLIGLQALFDFTWRSASPLGAIIDSSGYTLTTEELSLLELLALGKSDEAIGKSIGRSERTVARKVAEIKTKLNANTRFQAGVKAAKQNWL